MNSVTQSANVLSSAASKQQVRFFSRRRIAYPFYPAPKMGRTHPKDHKTSLRHQMNVFLGKKNYKGEYLENKYFHPAKDHSPNYIKPDAERGNPLVDIKTGKPLAESSNFRNTPNSHLQPFPQNRYCQTNYILSKQDRDEIYQKIVVENTPIQQVAIHYGIKIPRLEAVVKLKEIELKWNKKNLITPDLKKMSETMYKMFPLFEKDAHTENLSEIPVPVKTLESKFVTIAESEPFGPIDAAKVFGLEPAAQTLEKLGSGDHHLTDKSSKEKKREVFLAKSNKNDRFVFQFTKSKVGEVGYRYGTTLRDNKKDRRFTFDNSGKMVNALPKSG